MFKENAVATMYYYKTSDSSWTRTACTISTGTMGSYLGTVDYTKFILKQTRDDWLNYNSAETAAPTMIAWMNNDYVFKGTFDSATKVWTITDSIAMPCTANQVTAGCANERAFITLEPEHIDVGINYLAVLSSINCSARYQATAITNASVRYYKLDTVWDVDANNNGKIDSSEGLTPPAEVTVDWDKGWTCMDVPSSWNW